MSYFGLFGTEAYNSTNGLSAPGIEYKTCFVQVAYHLIGLKLRPYQKYNLVLLEKLLC